MFKLMNKPILTSLHRNKLYVSSYLTLWKGLSVKHAHNHHTNIHCKYSKIPNQQAMRSCLQCSPRSDWSLRNSLIWDSTVAIATSILWIKDIWAASTRENLSLVVCKQQRRRPACTSVQSNQRLCYSLFGKYHM